MLGHILVIPANAGIQTFVAAALLDSRFSRNDKPKNKCAEKQCTLEV